MSPSELLPLALPDEAISIVEMIRDNKTFLIVGHIRPDGDCLGSCLGMYHILKALGKSTRFFTAGPVPDVFRFLPGFDIVETDFPRDTAFDATLYVDTADAGRVFPMYEAKGLSAVIDHHVSNTRYATHNWVEGQATAAAEMVYHLAGALDVPITPEIATCLYTGIMTDTGGFRYANTSEMTFRVTTDLVSRGAGPAAIAEQIWDSRSPATVKVTALVLSTLNYEFDGRFAWNEVTQQMVLSSGDEPVEAEGLSSEMRSIRGVEVSVLFYETAEGHCRIGFRSRGDVNVSALAGLLGGGGHKNASGAFIAEDYLLARHRALNVVREYLTRHFNGR